MLDADNTANAIANAFFEFQIQEAVWWSMGSMVSLSYISAFYFESSLGNFHFSPHHQGAA